MRRRLPAAALLLAAVGRYAGAEGAAPFPTIMEIRFAGNEVTQPKVMLREMVVAVGDPADPERVERSRQGVLDLGLFRSVAVDSEPVAGGVRVVFTVKEKFYLLPFPRGDLKSDGELAYGAAVRWSNVRGLDENFNLYFEQREGRKEDIGRETTWVVGYSSPFVFDTRNNFSLSAAHTDRPRDADDGIHPYGERVASVQGLLTRRLAPGPDQPASRGWDLGGGLLWQDQNTSGAFAKEPYGMATGAVGVASYRDVRFKLFSEEGQSFGGRLGTAIDGLGADYDYTTYGAGYALYRPFGGRAHQTLHFIANGGLRFGGPPDSEAYDLGGPRLLRGYDSDFLEGDAFYLLQIECLRPVRWDWLRAVAILEAGNVFERPEDFKIGRVYTSLGLGLRVRVQYFVDFQVELGVAIPLDDADFDARLFGGRV